MTKAELQTDAVSPAARCFYNITFCIKTIYVKMIIHFFLYYFIFVISSQLFRIYSLLSDEGQVDRNMSQNTLNICNKQLFVGTDGLLEYTSLTAGLSCHLPLPASLKMPCGEKILQK